MDNKFDIRIMPLGNIYKFYGRCYHINEQNFEIESDVKIEHVATIEEAIAIQTAFIAKNTPEEVIIEDPIMTEQIIEPIIEEVVTNDSIDYGSIEEPIINNSEENTSTENI